LVSLPILSAILFQLLFGNTRYQYFCQQAAPLRLLHNNARGTTSRVSVRTHAVRPRCTVQGDVNYMRWTHVLGSVCFADERTSVKTLTTDSQTSALKTDHYSYSPVDTPRSCSAGDSPPPSSRNVISIITAVNCRPRLIDHSTIGLEVVYCVLFRLFNFLRQEIEIEIFLES